MKCVLKKFCVMAVMGFLVFPVTAKCVFAGDDDKDRANRLAYIELYLNDVIMQMLEEGESVDVEQAMEYYTQLLDNPVNINSASKNALEQLLILSDFQINSLLNYREENGSIISLAELSLINGFSSQLADVLSYFISFEDEKQSGKGSGKFFKDCNSTLLFKGTRVLEREKWYMPISEQEYKKAPNSRYIGTPFYTQIKYKCDYLSKIQVGFTLENDAGERFLSPIKLPMGDFFSFHAQVKNISLGKKSNMFSLSNIVVGDFSARFAQGLTLWNSFSLSSVANPGGLYRRGAVIIPYTSSDENNFFRGVAASAVKGFKKGGINYLEVSALFSYNALDANVKDGVYSSILTGGLHNTQSTFNSRKSMNEWLAGVNAVAAGERFKIGISWVTYKFDKVNGRKVEEYNKYQMYDGVWGNLSADMYYVFRGGRVFGEIAMDYGGSVAALCGALFNIGELEVGALLRSYSKSYIAPHAKAYSSITGCNNQQGGAVNVSYFLSRTLKLSGNIDFVYYPWLRFNVPESSAMVKGYVKVAYTEGRFNGYLSLTDKYLSYGSSNKIGLRGVFGYSLFRWMGVKLRGEVVGIAKPSDGSVGYNGAVDFDMKICRELRVQVRGSYFNCMDWDSRTYMYESDLPSSFVSQLYYGSGYSAYILINGKISRIIECFAKVGTIQYLKGGGENEISAPRSKLKLGVKMKF